MIELASEEKWREGKKSIGRGIKKLKWTSIMDTWKRNEMRAKSVTYSMSKHAETTLVSRVVWISKRWKLWWERSRAKYPALLIPKTFHQHYFIIIIIIIILYNKCWRRKYMCICWYIKINVFLKLTASSSSSRWRVFWIVMDVCYMPKISCWKNKIYSVDKS